MKILLDTNVILDSLASREPYNKHAMVASRKQLHDIIDVVDSSELNVLYQILIKFMPEDEPAPDEIEAIRVGREEIQQGKSVNHNDINWD